jgi:ParB family chromosome partitioning protein
MAKETSKSQIGKGIRALLTNIEERGTAPTAQEVSAITRQTMDVPVDAIEVNPFQPRTDFDEASLAELAQSIRVHGIIQPLTLRRLHEGRYQLIAGERRLRAARLAGLTAVPAFIRLADDQGLLEMAIVENLQRADLNAMEMAFSLQRLLDECSLTHEELSHRLGKSRSAVTNYLRLLKLPPQAQQALRNDEISMGHARAIAGLEDIAAQLMVLGEVMAKKLSVRETERLVADYHAPARTPKPESPAPGAEAPAEIRGIERDLRNLFGVKVNVQYKRGGTGEIRIPFASDHEFNEIIDMLNALEDHAS